jgi:uncharacterized Zn finger protein
VAQRRANAARELAKLAKKSGQAASPIVLAGRKIASTFWGKAWCDNLEAYSDYENRLPRGRTYVRNGSVVDLQISKGNVTALVSGSSLYRISIKINPLPPALWKSVQTECAGKIDSLMELLQGKLSSSVMEIVTRRERGLFPTPKEIDLDCSCPDWADMCKHIAAVLYGVGAKLDQNPSLLFLLRGVDAADLISKASAAEAVRQTIAGAPAMSESEMADVFGIELETRAVTAESKVQVSTPPPVKPATRPATKGKVQQKAKTPKKSNASTRNRITAAVKARWAKIKLQELAGKQARQLSKRIKTEAKKPARKTAP